MKIFHICYIRLENQGVNGICPRKLAGCQNIAGYKEKLWNKVCRLLRAHCIPLLFSNRPFCHNIRIAVKAEYNHSSLAGRIPRNVHVLACSMQFHTSRKPSGNCRGLRNVCLYHSTIRLLASRSSCSAKAHLMQIHPVQDDSGSWRR